MAPWLSLRTQSRLHIQIFSRSLTTRCNAGSYTKTSKTGNPELKKPSYKHIGLQLDTNHVPFNPERVIIRSLREDYPLKTKPAAKREIQRNLRKRSKQGLWFLINIPVGTSHKAICRFHVRYRIAQALRDELKSRGLNPSGLPLEDGAKSGGKIGHKGWEHGLKGTMQIYAKPTALTAPFEEIKADLGIALEDLMFRHRLLAEKNENRPRDRNAWDSQKPHRGTSQDRRSSSRNLEPRRRDQGSPFLTKRSARRTSHQEDSSAIIDLSAAPKSFTGAHNPSVEQQSL